KVHMGLLKGPAAVFAMKNAQDKLRASQVNVNTVQKTGNTILTALTKKMHGQAEAAAETFGGKIKAVKAQITDYGIKIGLFLIPWIEKLVSIITKATDWLGKHKVVAGALAAVIGGVLLAATIAWTVSLFTAGGALAFLISPITLVVVALAALAAG